jgi:hypothetical protein
MLIWWECFPLDIKAFLQQYEGSIVLIDNGFLVIILWSFKKVKCPYDLWHYIIGTTSLVSADFLLVSFWQVDVPDIMLFSKAIASPG